MGDVLRVRDLMARYSGGEGIGPVSFAVKPGEIVVAVGRNGAGKTTLIRALSTLMPHSGEVATGKISHDQKSSFRRATATLLDDPELPGWLTPREMAKWVEVLWDDDGLLERFDNRFKTLFEDEKHVGVLCDELSRGMKQRVAIALTVARNADAYLLDEPDAHLDLVSRFVLEELLRDVASAGAVALWGLGGLVLSIGGSAGKPMVAWGSSFVVACVWALMAIPLAAATAPQISIAIGPETRPEMIRTALSEVFQRYLAAPGPSVFQWGQSIVLALQVVFSYFVLRQTESRRPLIAAIVLLAVVVGGAIVRLIVT